MLSLLPCEHGLVRSFAIFLGCLAWVLSCFDAVSYYRAGVQQKSMEARLKVATTRAASAEAFAGQDSAKLSVRLLQDQAAIESDEIALGRDQKGKLSDAQDRQTLAADQAALQADRMMQYTVEAFAQTDPNPQVVAAVNKVDLDRRLLGEAFVTRKRDLKLSHALIALWVLVAGTALLAFRRGRGEEPGEEAPEEEQADLESELAATEDTQG